MPLDFTVDLDALTSLRRTLAGLTDDLATGPAGQALGQETLNPRTGMALSTIRANGDAVGAFAYGLLRESNPLGQAHEEVSRTVHALVGELHALIGELEAHAGRGAERYEAAEATVLGAVREVDGEVG